MARFIQRRPMQHCWNSQPLGNDANEDEVDGAESPSKIHHEGSGAETRSPPWMHVVLRLILEEHWNACRSRFERMSAVGRTTTRSRQQ